MDIEFAVSAWAAYAPGLHSSAQWQHWAAQPCLPEGQVDSQLPEVPALLRRRLGPLGRLATRAAIDAAGVHAGLPTVFASRYGDAERALGLVASQAEGRMLSPADFTLSVHNAIGALYSIARKDVGPHTAVAAGRASAAAGLVEAVGMLVDGARQVLLVSYDEPLPAPYAHFADEASVPYAWAWRVTRPQAGQPALRLVSSAAAAAPLPDTPPTLPFGLAAMRFMASDIRELQCTADGVSWTWGRDA